MPERRVANIAVQTSRPLFPETGSSQCPARHPDQLFTVSMLWRKQHWSRVFLPLRLPALQLPDGAPLGCHLPRPLHPHGHRLTRHLSPHHHCGAQAHGHVQLWNQPERNKLRACLCGRNAGPEGARSQDRALERAGRLHAPVGWLHACLPAACPPAHPPTCPEFEECSLL